MQAEADQVDELRRSLRASLARDLHDGPIRDLTNCVIQLEVIRGASADERMREAIRQAEDRARSALDGLREMMADLRGDAPKQRFSDALRSVFNGYHRSFGVEFILVVSPAWPELLPGHVAVALLRIVEEAATNAIRHAAATRVVVELQTSDGELRIDVDDDGRGIREAELRFPGGGLVGMRERAALLGGRLNIARRPRGTHVRVSIPLQVARVSSERHQ